MNLIKWREEYSVCIPQMDKQHQKLLKLLNQLLSSLRNDSVQTTASEICSKLRQYAKEHFAEEEAFLLENNFTELQLQKQEHKYFITQIDKLASDIATKKNTFKEMNHFLRHWFKNHILNEDMKYKPTTPKSQ